MLVSRSIRTGALYGMLCLLAVQSVERLSAVSTTLVISEFRTRGPSGGNDEFIELRNVSAGAINLSGWNVLGSNGSGLTDVRANLPNISLNAGCSFLLTNSNTNGYSGGVPGDQTYAVGITDDGGIALQAPGGSLADQVGLSGGSAYGEGTRLGNFGSSNSNRSYQRQGADTDNNALNFTQVSPSQPTNAGAGCTGGGGPTPTNPTGTGSASPSTVNPGQMVLLTVSVVPGANPTSTGLVVRTDLTSIGGSATQQFFDDGTQGDQTSGDNVFSFRVTVAGNAAAGVRNLAFTVTDAQGRSGSGGINFTIGAPSSTNPTGTGTAVPASVPAGEQVSLRVTVVPGTNPTSTELAVFIDATAIGGSSHLGAFDLGIGTNCDLVTGDKIFTECVNVGLLTTPGSKTLPVSVTDAEGRTASTTIVLSVTAPLDGDNDGLPTRWEEQFGLSPTSGAGADGPSGDPDGDGLTNLQEYQQQSHPRGTFTRYLSEGATGFFETRFALLNVDGATRSVLLRFLRDDGQLVTRFVQFTIGFNRRVTIDASTIPGLEGTAFSTVVEADSEVVIDRTMTWDQRGYGSHAETAVEAPASTWYLAEGATHSGFNLFYLLQNSTPSAATVSVTYLLPAPAAPVMKNYAIAGNSRFTIWVDLIPELENSDVSAIISSDQPIIVERAMYLDAQGLQFGAGHESAGVTAPATNWFLAEGATGDFFDLFVLIANPNPTAAAIRATYLLPNGSTVVKTYGVPANSRFNIWVDLEGTQLANTAVSTTIESTNGVPVIVERSMWWPGSSATWQEAHNSPGSTSTGVVWGLAEGEAKTTDPRAVETYILIANTSPFPGVARVTLFYEFNQTLTKDFALPANSRVSVSVKDEFASGGLFGTVVQSIGATPAQIVVERAMYSNAEGVVWAAGTNALGTPLTSVP